MTYNHKADSVINTLQNLGDVFQDLVGLADEAGSLLFLNRAGREMVGIADTEELEREQVQTFFPDWSVSNLISRGRLNETRSVKSASLLMSRDATLSTKDGRTLSTHLSVHAHLSDDCRVEFFLFVARDLTNLKQIENERSTIEERLLDSCRMETIGRLSVGIAQNLQRTLVQIAGNTETALRLTAPTSEVNEPLEKTLKALNTARHAVAQIIDAASPRRDTGKPVRIKHVVSEVVSMARASLPGTIVIRQHFEDAGDPIAMGPVRIRDIVLNLVLNAREALELTGGVLDIKLDTVDVGAVADANGHPPRARCYARITVSDNGPGMPEETVAKIFTSSPLRKICLDPARLGLSLMNRLVEDCGGAVTVHNKIGRGTSFHILLPTGSINN